MTASNQNALPSQCITAKHFFASWWKCLKRTLFIAEEVSFDFYRFMEAVNTSSQIVEHFISPKMAQEYRNKNSSFYTDLYFVTSTQTMNSSFFVFKHFTFHFDRVLMFC